jgi:hypothetical protein
MINPSQPVVNTTDKAKNTSNREIKQPVCHINQSLQKANKSRSNAARQPLDHTNKQRSAQSTSQQTGQ